MNVLLLLLSASIADQHGGFASVPDCNTHFLHLPVDSGDTGLSVQWTGRCRDLPHVAPFSHEVFLLAYMGMHATQALGAWITDGTKQIHLEIIGADTNGLGARGE